jgi:hypothetical protein
MFCGFPRNGDVCGALRTLIYKDLQRRMIEYDRNMTKIQNAWDLEGKKTNATGRPMRPTLM